MTFESHTTQIKFISYKHEFWINNWFFCFAYTYIYIRVFFWVVLLFNSGISCHGPPDSSARTFYNIFRTVDLCLYNLNSILWKKEYLLHREDLIRINYCSRLHRCIIYMHNFISFGHYHVCIEVYITTIKVSRRRLTI